MPVVGSWYSVKFDTPSIEPPTMMLIAERFSTQTAMSWTPSPSTSPMVEFAGLPLTWIE